MKIAHALGVVAAIALIVFSIAFPVPEKHLYVSSYAYDVDWSESRGEEYVGGDAYNYQMEASLKAGYMGGVLAMKAITFTGGLLLLFQTVYSALRICRADEQNRYLQMIHEQMLKGKEEKEEA